VLQAVANIARYPWLNVDALFDLSLQQPVYAPALPADQPPDAWTLFLKFTGSFSSVQDENNLLNGPGAIAIDKKGFLWVNDNYAPQPVDKLACAGERLAKFYPWGENFPRSPYFGGGLSGAGFGISIAPNGLIWVGNFGFAGLGCPTPAADSVSAFRPDGKPLSPDGTGLTAGPIAWPQATVADRRGNIWIANCYTDSVTVYPRGRPRQAFNVPIPPIDAQGTPAKPFGLAIDNRGRAWVAGNFNSTVAVIGPEGDLIEVIPPETPGGETQLTRPMGVASDSRGNVWVANSDYMDNPCPTGPEQLGAATNPLITLFRSEPGGPPDVGETFNGGGVTIPWGIAVDGNDTVWVANFGFRFLETPWQAPNRVSHFCGVDPAKCPPTKQAVGRAISPMGTGYTSDALDRNTGISIDPSGNVWLANNWKAVPLLTNPGGNSIAVLIGAAGPLKTPLIGTPQSFDQRPERGRRSRHERGR
jgi:sugar lactone lactonase YvrE